MFAIIIETAVPVAADWCELVQTAVSQTLTLEEVPPDSSLTLLLTTDEQLRELNLAFRAEDKPTDVLSFPTDHDFPGAAVNYLGDIAVSVPYAVRQAQAGGHDTAAELQLLAVHGTLHLLGYDHDNDAAKRVMWQRQTAVLQQLGVGHINPTET